MTDEPSRFVTILPGASVLMPESMITLQEPPPELIVKERRRRKLHVALCLLGWILSTVLIGVLADVVCSIVHAPSPVPFLTGAVLGVFNGLFWGAKIVKP